MQKFGMIAVYASSVGVNFLAVAERDWRLWLAGLVAGVAALAWFSRLVWRTSGERQKVLGKICTQADRMENLGRAMSEDLGEVKATLSAQGETLAAVVKEIAEWHGVCRARGPIYEKMLSHLTKGP